MNSVFNFYYPEIDMIWNGVEIYFFLKRNFNGVKFFLYENIQAFKTIQKGKGEENSRDV